MSVTDEIVSTVLPYVGGIVGLQIISVCSSIYNHWEEKKWREQVIQQLVRLEKGGVVCWRKQK